MENKTRVLVFDGSFIHTQLLSDALRRDHGLEVFSCNSSQVAPKALFEHDIDVLIISANLVGQPYGGLEILRELRASRSELRAIALLDAASADAVLEAFRAGARGVFSRQESVDLLCKCVQCVHSGQIWAKSQEMSHILDALATAPALQALDAKGLNLLSKRETEIVECVAEGLTNREIAERLKLSRHTIKNSLFRIFDKLGVSNRLELLLMTLSRDSSPQFVLSHILRTPANFRDDRSFQECLQAAEQGSIVAQLLLAEMHSTRKGDSTDHVLAHKWYLIASVQLAQATKNGSKLITKAQLIEAERMAAEWLKRSQKASAVVMEHDFPAPRVKAVGE